MPTTRIRLVTGNAGKVREVAAALPGVEVVGDDRGYPEIQAATLGEVTEAGARHLLADVEPPFALEDSGLFVDALRGFPGVYSRHALDTIGVDGILALLRDAPTRTAHFATDLAYVDADGAIHHHKGRVDGHIVASPRGSGGFGFDPIFAPADQSRTFAEMTAADKTRLSHRGQAVASLARALGLPLGKTANR